MQKKFKNLQKEGEWLTNTASGAEDGDLLLDGGSGGEGAGDTGGEHSKKSPLKFSLFFARFFPDFSLSDEKCEKLSEAAMQSIIRKSGNQLSENFLRFFWLLFFEKKN